MREASNGSQYPYALRMEANFTDSEPFFIIQKKTIHLVLVYGNSTLN